MRMIVYNKTSSDGTTGKHFVTLERVDHFTFSDKDGATKMFALCGDNVHMLNDSKKIESPSGLVSKLINLSDRSIVEIGTMIDESNVVAKSKRR